MNKRNLNLKVGTDFSFAFRFRDKETNALKDLTGYTGRMSIKDKYKGAVIATANVTIDVATNIITAKIPNATTANIPTGTAVYDIDVTNAAGAITPVFYGEINILPNTNI